MMTKKDWVVSQKDYYYPFIERYNPEIETAFKYIAEKICAIADGETLSDEAIDLLISGPARHRLSDFLKSIINSGEPLFWNIQDNLIQNFISSKKYMLGSGWPIWQWISSNLRFHENENSEERKWYRRFAIVKLSNDQIEKEFEVHEDFQRFVGTHFDGKQIRTPPTFEKGKMKIFYDKHSEYIKSRHFEDNEVIGWMEN